MAVEWQRWNHTLKPKMRQTNNHKLINLKSIKMVTHNISKHK